MKKEIKSYGNSKVILLSSEECRIYGEKGKPLDVGDVVELDLWLVGNKDFKKKLWEANEQTGASFGSSE